jgi:hypothetical protein
MHHLRVIWNQSFGAAVDGPGSLLNYQGHPVERLTPDLHVTIPGAKRWAYRSRKVNQQNCIRLGCGGRQLNAAKRSKCGHTAGHLSRRAPTNRSAATI